MTFTNKDLRFTRKLFTAVFMQQHWSHSKRCEIQDHSLVPQCVTMNKSSLIIA